MIALILPHGFLHMQTGCHWPKFSQEMPYLLVHQGLKMLEHFHPDAGPSVKDTNYWRKSPNVRSWVTSTDITRRSGMRGAALKQSQSRKVFKSKGIRTLLSETPASSSARRFFGRLAVTCARKTAWCFSPTRPSKNRRIRAKTRVKSRGIGAKTVKLICVPRLASSCVDEERPC